MKAYIAQVPTSPQTPADLTAWGLLATLVLFAGREAIAIFRQQNNQEQKLIEQLLARQQEREDRIDQRHDELLNTIKAILERTCENTVKLQGTVDEMVRSMHGQTRSTLENYMGVRQELSDLNAATKELLRRSDKHLGIDDRK